MDDQEPSWDEMTVARMAAGDAAALGEAYDQLGSLVFGLARRVVRDPSLAEEVTQEVFSELWQKPARYDSARGPLRAFLATVTHRRAVDCVRRNDAARRRDLSWYRGQSQSDRREVEDTVESTMVAADVRRAIDDLPDEQRQSIMLAYFGGYTHRELAELFGIPEGTAKTRIRLGLAKLGVALEAKGLTR
ncbi:MAG: sigma-70 family RNA polymerase sigma factor [Acidimicrobiales bacterium]